MRKIQTDAAHAPSRKQLIYLSLLCVSANLFAASFSTAPGNAQPNTIETIAAPHPATEAASTTTSSCPATITQSSSQAVTTGNSVSCNTGPYHTDNSYWRAFDMATLTGGAEYCINSVSFGVEWANNP